MNSSTPWLNFQNNLYANEALGFFLDYNDSGISTPDIDRMRSLFDNALQAMSKLEQGAISNPDENRQVGHYWLRNPQLAPTSHIKHEIKGSQKLITSFADKIRSGQIQSPDGKNFSHVLIVGIGGSALGPQFIGDALGTTSGLTPHFLDNTDPDGIDRTLNSLSEVLAQTLVLVVSKSGGTAETRNGML